MVNTLNRLNHSPICPLSIPAGTGARGGVHLALSVTHDPSYMLVGAKENYTGGGTHSLVSPGSLGWLMSGGICVHRIWLAVGCAHVFLLPLPRRLHSHTCSFCWLVCLISSKITQKLPNRRVGQEAITFWCGSGGRARMNLIKCYWTHIVKWIPFSHSKWWTCDSIKRQFPLVSVFLNNPHWLGSFSVFVFLILFISLPLFLSLSPFSLSPCLFPFPSLSLRGHATEV